MLLQIQLYVLWNHDAAEETAIMYTMMGCCKLAGADFRKWTTYVLTHIHEYDNDYSKDLEDFLSLRLKEKGIQQSLYLEFL
ncbi:hypothetical protein NNC51_08460 [Prevotella copri]|uniref:Uncharacterized protein n=1 Tax=Segatella copri TaxID=165179 RepID=A0AAW5IWW1_9BACT|nr:hypothetical protein [Segatella copri]MCP9552726.1 hypothetical protein [Segatella copri]MCP9573503.1 hypothetical protein [Segatella copri]MCP9576573.1 hypothetical protein [Segatella copri]MCP9579357.1 hypothetical protein [Segatella copri]MCP9582399.1 hypothetical protein [Segatella copri]